MYGRQGYKSYLTKEAIALQEAIAEAIDEQYEKIPHFDGEVIIKIKIERDGSNSWDLDNQAKCIIDGLVKAGVLKDDRYVMELHMLKGLRKLNCIQLTVEPYHFGKMY
jgi:Holliday junction resolvase RusA-like endonuclease